LKVFGDVSPIVQGNIVMTFENIKDPQGLKQLVRALERVRAGPVGRMGFDRRMGGPFRRFREQADGLDAV
jgi:hypothetical protein